MESLKSCPFCGGPSKLYQAGGYWHARCDSAEWCEATVCCTPDEGEAVARWNRRTPGPDVSRLMAEVELLRRHIAEQDQALKKKEGELSRWAYSFIDVERERDEERAEVDRLKAELAARPSVSRLLVAIGTAIGLIDRGRVMEAKVTLCDAGRGAALAEFEAGRG